MRMLEGAAAEAYVKELGQRGSRLDDIEPTVRRIVQDVRTSGDPALLKYAREFDGLGASQNLRLSHSELKAAWRRAPAKLKSALRTASRNIQQFCQWQKPKEWKRSRNGITVGQLIRPLDSIGCYVPGGRFPLVSSLLMTVVPAQVAGVKNIRVVSPRPSSELLAAASMLEIREFYRVGGAQAIAALAYGTDSIARVDKIVGPGNLYVTAAKKLVSFDCAIDMLAGPTEVVIIRWKGNPAFIAADLLAQAEHDPEALAVFITTSRNLAGAITTELNDHRRVSAEHGRLSTLMHENAKKSLRQRGAVLIANSRNQAFAWANRIAPEHIAIEKKDLPRVRNAGSVFIGDYSAQAAGDYASGPNHVLPTAGAARFRGGLSVMDFVKVISVQELSAAGLLGIAPAILRLAETEGLHAHAACIRARSVHD
jgi:histidinol dehydrogenase